MTDQRKKDGTWVHVARLPKCDFCAEAAKFDAQMSGDRPMPWAYFCADHFETNSIRRLGTGYGQELVLVQS